MTQIVAGCKTKKQLQEAARALNNGAILGPGFMPLLQDPSIFNPRAGGKKIPLSEVNSFDVWLVTNHPHRTWFASVERRNGKLVVK